MFTLQPVRYIIVERRPSAPGIRSGRANFLRTFTSTRLRSFPALPAQACRAAFTITELLVVVAVIALILGIGLPAFSSMSTESRFSSATASLSGALTRTHIASVSANNLTLMRFMPATWETDTGDDPQRRRDRQRGVSFRYVTSVDDPNNVDGPPRYAERFERIENGPELLLPADIWVGPVESLDPNRFGHPDNPAHPLNGKFDRGDPNTAFSWSWNPREKEQPDNSRARFNPDFLDADDFTIAFDPQTGLRRSFAGDPKLAEVRLYAQDPTIEGRSGHPRMVTLKRRFFSGVVLYQREPFMTLGNDRDQTTTDRRLRFLMRNGRPFYVSRFGGGLISGSQGER